MTVSENTVAFREALSWAIDEGWMLDPLEFSVAEKYYLDLGDDQIEEVIRVANERLEYEFRDPISTTVEVLRTRAQWLDWKREVDPRNPDKPRKVPRMARDLRRRASSTDPATWCSYDEAQAVVDSGKADGVGYAITDADTLVLVDLDYCRGEDGKLHPVAKAIVRTLDSYAERSQSGDGVHILVHGKMPAGHVNQTIASWGGELAAWDRNRLAYLTGDVILDRPIMWRQAELNRVFAEHVPKRAVAARAQPTVPIDLDDRTLLDKALAAKNGQDFADLYAGRWEGRFPSQSEADYNLCLRLAWWTQRNPEQIDRIFRSSALMRDKWVEPRGTSTYGAQTINEAISRCTEVYEPRG